MKIFAVKHPFFIGLLIFLVIATIFFILSLGVGIIVAKLHSSRKPIIPNDPNDGNMMGIGFLVYFGTLVGFIVGAVFGLGSTIYFLSLKNKRLTLP